MKRGRIAAVVLGGFTAAVLGASGSAVAEDSLLKQKMGEDFAGMQVLLKALIVSNYTAVPDHLDIIRQHATELTLNVPDNAKDDRDRFLIYAYNLRGHSEDLKSIIDLLIEQDAAGPNREALAPNQLRGAAAAHFGGAVTMCVACHNLFPPTPPR